MTILMLVTRRQKRGAEVSAANLGFQLQQLGYKIIWVGLYAPGEDTLDIQGSVTEDLKGSDQLFFSIRKWKELGHLLRIHKVDIIQANGSDTLRYAVAAALVNHKVKVIYRNISKLSFWMKNNNFKKIYNHLLFRKVSVVVSVGHESAKDFITTMKIPEGNVKVIRRGIPLQVIDKEAARIKMNQEWSFEENEFILLWAGSLSPEKNPEFIIQVMLELKQLPVNCSIIIAGKGSEEQKIQLKIAEHKLSNVKLAGYRNDVSLLLAGADLLVLTSFIEGVPGIVLEAAVQQTPAVAVNRGGVWEAIRNEKTGMLLKDHNAKEFAEVVYQLLIDTEKRNLMGKKAAELVRNEFDEVKNATAFSQLYQSLKVN